MEEKGGRDSVVPGPAASFVRSAATPTASSLGPNALGGRESSIGGSAAALARRDEFVEKSPQGHYVKARTALRDVMRSNVLHIWASRISAGAAGGPLWRTHC